MFLHWIIFSSLGGLAFSNLQNLATQTRRLDSQCLWDILKVFFFDLAFFHFEIVFCGTLCFWKGIILSGNHWNGTWRRCRAFRCLAGRKLLFQCGLLGSRSAWRRGWTSRHCAGTTVPTTTAPVNDLGTNKKHEHTCCKPFTQFQKHFKHCGDIRASTSSYFISYFESFCTSRASKKNVSVLFNPILTHPEIRRTTIKLQTNALTWTCIWLFEWNHANITNMWRKLRNGVKCSTATAMNRIYIYVVADSGRNAFELLGP